MQPFRKSTPKRTCTKTYAKYRDYKLFLREDFNKRCGYCDDLDTICGGSRGFHIDHFRPQKKFKYLKKNYSNLVYACPYCNGAKSDNWPTETENPTYLDGKGYIDPCDTHFDNHFERYDNGRIRPKTEVGKYMFRHLKLGLRRHQLAWMSERLGELLQELANELENTAPNIQTHLAEHHVKLTQAYFKYKHLFEETL